MVHRSPGRGRLACLTTHGRTNAALTERLSFLPPEAWERYRQGWEENGFSFLQVDTLEGMPYGGSLTKPSWVVSLVETDPRVKLISMQEAAWDAHQDVLSIQRVG